MESHDWISYKIQIRDRLKIFSLNILKLSEIIPETIREKVTNYQLTKSGTSMYSNLRAALQGWSRADFFSKVSISVEEADKTETRIDLLINSDTQNNGFTLNLHS